MDAAQLLKDLQPLVAILKELDLKDSVKTKTELDQRAGLQSPMIQKLRAACEEGFQAGWLTPKENAGVRFGRLAKDLAGFSVDAVVMSAPGPKHRHGNGEIDLCFTRSGKPTFDGKPEGWVVYPPESVHVPTVSGGEMLILYFLPKGAIEFL